jgi:intein/homing endonuclease
MIFKKIIKIEEIDEREMIDIEVSGNHLFYANNILTHNSSSDVEITDTSECIFVDEMVEMRNGFIKKISEVSVGDQIKSQDSYKTVMMVHHKKEKECVKIVTKNGKTIIVSKEHIFPTNEGRKSFNSGLIVGDHLNTNT